jgi:hypothetical protein
MLREEVVRGGVEPPTFRFSAAIKSSKESSRKVSKRGAPVLLAERQFRALHVAPIGTCCGMQISRFWMALPMQKLGL